MRVAPCRMLAVLIAVALACGAGASSWSHAAVPSSGMQSARMGQDRSQPPLAFEPATASASVEFDPQALRDLSWPASFVGGTSQPRRVARSWTVTAGALPSLVRVRALTHNYQLDGG